MVWFIHTMKDNMWKQGEKASLGPKKLCCCINTFPVTPPPPTAHRQPVTVHFINIDLLWSSWWYAEHFTGMTGEMIVCRQRWGCYGDIAKDHVTCFRVNCRHAQGRCAVPEMGHLTSTGGTNGAHPAEPVCCFCLRLFVCGWWPTRSNNLYLMMTPEEETAAHMFWDKSPPKGGF